MFCPNCGEKLPEESTFCGKCGTRLPKMQSPVGEGAAQETYAESGDSDAGIVSGAEEISAGSDGFDADAGGVRSGAAGDSSEPAGSAGSGVDDGGRKGGRGKKAAVIACIVAAVAAAAAVSAFLIISGGIPDSGSGGAEDDDGVITVTFDCGTEETADSGADRSNEANAAADSEADASSGDSTDSATADVVGTSSVNYAPETQDVTESGLAQCPAYPTKEGYIFGGWYTDEDCTEEFDFSTEVTEDLTLYARWLDPEDEEAQITEEEFAQFESGAEGIAEILSEYWDENGYVAEENTADALDAIESYVQILKEKGDITYYNREESAIYMEFSGSIPFLCYIAEEDSLGDPDNMDLLYVMTNENEGFAAMNEDQSAYLSGIDGIQVTEMADEQFTISQLMEMEIGDLLLWCAHGCYIEDVHSCLITCEEVTDWKMAVNYYEMIGNKEVITTYAGSEDATRHFGISGDFVLRYFPEMEDTLVVLNVCKGGEDAYLSAAFLTKGAEAVIAYDDTVNSWYAESMSWDLFRYMSGQSGDKTVYSVREALELAKEDMGETCNEPTYASVLLFGDDSAENVFEAGLDYEDPSFTKRHECETQALIYVLDDDAYNYTLWAGIEGMLSIDSALELDPAELTVSVVNDVTGATVNVVTPDEDGSFSIDRMSGREDCTYTLYVQKGDTVLLTMEEMEVQAHRILDVGSLSVEAAQLTVYVRNEDGEILEGVSAQVTGSDGTAYEMTAGTDGAGSVIYQVKVLPGEYSLSLSADGYEDRTETVTVEEITLLEYTMEDVDRTAMYQAYYDKLMELQEEYGEATLDAYEYESDCYSYSLSGVFLAQLVDFDADGSEELLLVYREYPGHIKLTQMDCHIEVWRYEGNDIVKCFDGSGKSGNGNVTAIYLLYVDGLYYLSEGKSDGFDENSIVGLRDGNFTEAVNLCEKDNDPYPDFYINSIPVSQDEYEEEYSRWFDNGVYYLESFYSGEDYDHDPRPILEETLAALREYLSAAEDGQDSEDEPG